MFTCRKCREPFYVQEAEERWSNLRLYVQCMNGHKGKREIPLLQAKNSAPELFKGLFTCIECGLTMGLVATDVRKNRMEYVFLCPIHGPQERRIPAQYHSAVSEMDIEEETAKSVTTAMNCPRCGEGLVVDEIEDSAGVLILKSRCPRGHKTTRFIPRETQEGITNKVMKRFLSCDSCGLPVNIDDGSIKGDKLKLQVSCPVHGSSKKEIPAQFAGVLDAVSQSVSEGAMLQSVLKCKDCGKPLSIRSIEEAREDYKLKTRCANGHSYELIQHLDWSPDVIDEIAKAVFKCNECDLLGEITSRKVDSKGAEIEIVCPVHQINRKGLTVDSYKRIEEREDEIDRMPSIEESLKCVKCGTPIVIRDSGFNKGVIETKVECEKGHGDNRYYAEDFRPEVLEMVYDRMFECHKCHQRMEFISFEEEKDKGRVTISCEKHGDRRFELPSTHGLLVRDAFTASMTLPQVEALTESTLGSEDSFKLQFDPGLDSEEMFNIMKSVIEQHDVQFIADVESKDANLAWYYGKALRGNQFVVKGSVSGDMREIEINGYSDNEKNLSSLVAHMRENLREVLLRVHEEADDIQPLVVQCVHCNAALSKRGLPGETTRCGHCGVPLHW
ncbi:MAG: hypothetical protein JSW05_10235 [Candidatus Thorarchaeota archaeon]|nr:MAG: hypothetical protein JSW05_10235 [Candidatus Thorarchaeota archaeon]